MGDPSDGGPPGALPPPLGGILFNFAIEERDATALPCDRADVLACGRGIFRAIAVIQQTTTSHHLRVAQDRVREREERLRAFNRTISHEFKNRFGAREQLFSRFFRAHEHSATHVEGTGLGLSIVRETIEMLDGRVWAEFPDEGSIFAFALPHRRGADRRAREPEQAEAGMG